MNNELFSFEREMRLYVEKISYVVKCKYAYLHIYLLLFYGSIFLTLNSLKIAKILKATNINSKFKW